jgi:hypothetical protein
MKRIRERERMEDDRDLASPVFLFSQKDISNERGRERDIEREGGKERVNRKSEREGEREGDGNGVSLISDPSLIFLSISPPLPLPLPTLHSAVR